MTIKEMAERLIAGEEIGFVPLPQMYRLAEHLGADTSLAKRLRGTGSQSDTLIEAIGKRVQEIRALKGDAEESPQETGEGLKEEGRR